MDGAAEERSAEGRTGEEHDKAGIQSNVAVHKSILTTSCFHLQIVTITFLIFNLVSVRTFLLDCVVVLCHANKTSV